MPSCRPRQNQNLLNSGYHRLTWCLKKERGARKTTNKTKKFSLVAC